MKNSMLSPYDQTMIHAYVIASIIIRELRNGQIHVHDRSLKAMLNDLDVAVQKHEIEVDNLMRKYSLVIPDTSPSAAYRS